MYSNTLHRMARMRASTSLPCITCRCTSPGLRESAKAAVATAQSICEHHQALAQREQIPSATFHNVHSLLLHKRVLLEGCVLRVGTLESRMQNMANLAFQTVNQRDSAAMRSDSEAMKVIAILTVVFLPVTAVATVSRSTFFSFDPDTRTVLVANSFWVFWAVTVPLTLTVLSLYIFWSSGLLKRLGKP